MECFLNTLYITYVFAHDTSYNSLIYNYCSRYLYLYPPINKLLINFQIFLQLESI